jgi:transcriptional regulator GlxA family with amidase domain
MTAPHRIVLVGFPDAQVLDIVGPLEVFARTARWLADRRLANGPAYETELVGLTAGPIATSGGLELAAARSFREVAAADTLLVAGGIGWEAAARDGALLAWLRDMAPKVQRIGSICTGSLVLAAAGLLGGRRATTHWAYFDDLVRLAPDCEVAPDAIFVQDGRSVHLGGGHHRHGHGPGTGRAGPRQGGRGRASPRRW